MNDPGQGVVTQGPAAERRGARQDRARDARAEGERVAPDLRLVPAALAVWAVTLVGLLLGPVAGGTVTAVAAVAALVAFRRHRSPWLLAAAGCAAAAGAAVSVHAAAVLTHPLHEAAAHGAAATLRVTLRDDPRLLRLNGPGEPRVAVPAVLVTAETGNGHWASGGRVLLLAPAQGWTGLLPGQEVVAEGLLAPPERDDLTVAVLRVRGPPRHVGPPPWWQAAAGGLRAGLRDVASTTLAPAEAGLLPGLVVGDTSGLARETDDDFRASGLTHLLAVSGANIAILSGAVLGLLRLLRADPRVAAALAGAALVGFVVLARPSPSVVRAAAMGAIALVALASGRRRSAVPALAVAVAALLMVDPALAIDPGFALSALATASLVLCAPGWAVALRRHRVPPGLAEALAVAAAASVVTAPVVAGLGGTVSPVVVVANLLAEPAVAPATVLGVLAALLSPVAPPLAGACVWAAGPFVSWLVGVADRAAAIPGATVPWPAGVGGALLMVAALTGIALLARSRRWRAVLVALVVGAALVVVPTRVVPPGWPPPGWVVVACDVGQGDAVVLATTRPGHAVLVDTGPDDGPVASCLDRLGVRAIDLVVLSHLHADHIGGLGGALRGRAVAAVAVGPVHEPQPALREVARRAAAAGVPVVELDPGRRLAWPGLGVDVLGPPHPAASVDPTDGTQVNDTSLVLRASTRAGTVLLPGDAELGEQSDLLGLHTDLHADVLKMPHHGSRYSSPAFLAAVSPRAVLVSVGAGNPYGHPAVPLLAALAQAGAAVRRTDRSGDVAVTASAPDDGGRPHLDLVARGDPLPAPRRRAPRARSRRVTPVGRGRRAVHRARAHPGAPPPGRRSPLSGRPGPRAPPRSCWARSRSGRPARPRRPAS